MSETLYPNTREEADKAYALAQEINALIGPVPFRVASAAIACTLTLGLRELSPENRELVLTSVIETARNGLKALDELKAATTQ